VAFEGQADDHFVADDPFEQRRIQGQRRTPRLPRQDGRDPEAPLARMTESGVGRFRSTLEVRPHAVLREVARTRAPKGSSRGSRGGDVDLPTGQEARRFSGGPPDDSSVRSRWYFRSLGKPVTHE
jgi:hypothetical protein